MPDPVISNPPDFPTRVTTTWENDINNWSIAFSGFIDSVRTYIAWMQDTTPATIGAANATHASQHASGGVDPVTPAAIGAAHDGRLVKSVAGGSAVSLTTAEAAHGVIELTGAITANIDVTFPATSRAWIVVNSTTGDYSITCKVAGGTGVTLERGGTVKTLLAYNGTDIVQALDAPKFAIGSFSRNIGCSSGSQYITGVGFKPRAVIFIGAITGTITASWGFDNGTSRYSIGQYATGLFTQTSSESIILFQDASNRQFGHVASLDADGFTLAWTLTGTPASATANIYYLAMR